MTTTLFAALASLPLCISPAQADSPFLSAEALVGAGDFTAAETILQNTRFQGREAIPAAYLLAVVYARTGRLDRAEKLLREILSREPGIDTVRIELVEILLAQNKRQAAGYQLNRLIDTADLTRDSNQLEQLSRRAGTTRGFSLSGYFSLAPSTNVNDGTSQSTVMIGGLPFTIANGAREQSGIGVRAGAVAGYSHMLTENLAAYASLSAGFSDYSNDDYDKQQGEIRVGLRRNELRYSLQAEAIFDRHWQNFKPYSLGIGGRVAAKWNFAQNWWVSAEVIHMNRSFDATRAAEASTTRATGTLRRAFSNQIAVSVSSSFERETVSARPWNSYDSKSLTLGMETPIAFGLRMNAYLTVGTRDFEDLFPGLRLVRQDRFGELRGAFRKDDFQIAGLSPIIGLFHKQQSSNVAFYDYRTSGMDLTFTKAF
ncbi:Protein of unknown function (DUF560)/Tetratricopeptide repeat [Hoeflea sp. IMCC20628]|uniref:surface lipoprotein assembly modifier n=1 Tax=Hoeflea sp. IMCC20628 TaxID=1620421 RepID=UPI00063ABF51|nr:surface lipoprotein assembly modifier [Hoeflea sp. IMCC20628]AKH99148.1 Protein of unknown function (DUF560)/Tetratricopeptide repeat [Hoeflea sp. IMCC20628]